MKKTKIVKWAPEPVDIRKKEPALPVKNRENVTNLALISLRRRYHSSIKNNETVEAKVQSFNNYVKKQKIKDIAKVIHYLMSDLAD